MLKTLKSEYIPDVAKNSNKINCYLMGFDLPNTHVSDNLFNLEIFLEIISYPSEILVSPATKQNPGPPIAF